MSQGEAPSTKVGSFVQFINKSADKSLRYMGFIYYAIFILLMFFANAVFALTPKITYQGRILKPNGEPLEAANVQFRLQVRTPNVSACLMYEETKSVNMLSSSGTFSLTLNDGLGTRTDSTGLDVDRIFANNGTFTLSAPTCADSTNTFTPTADASRKFRVLFNDGSGWSAIPDMEIAMAPMAIEAMQIGGYKPENFVRVVNGSGVPQSLSPLAPAQYTELLALIGGTSTQYQQAGELMGGNLPMGTMAHGYALRMGASGTWEAYDPGAGGGGSGTVTSVVAGTGLSGGNIISAGTLSLAAIGTVGTGYKISYDEYGRVTGSAAIAEADLPTITTAGKVSGDAITSGTIGGTTSMSTSGTVTASQVSTRGVYISNMEPKTISILAPAAITGSGYTLTLPDSAGGAGQVLTTNGTGGLSWTSPAGGSVTSVGGTAPIQVTGTSTVTVSVDDATTSAKGVVQLATSGGTMAGHVVQANDPRLSDARTTSGTAGGDLTGSYPVPTVAAIRNVAVNATAPSGAGQVLRYNGTTEYAPAYLSLADIRSTIGPGHAQTFPSTSCTAKQTLTWSSITDTLTCSDITITAADVAGTLVNGGQSGAVVAGTNDLNTLTLETNNTARLTIGTTGNVGIGTTNPNSIFQVSTTGSDPNYIQQTAVSGTNTISQGGQNTNEIVQSRSGAGWGVVTNGSWLGGWRTTANDGAGHQVDATIIRAEVDGAPGANDMPGRLVFYTTPDGTSTATEKMRITNSGNVGIGTTSPSKTLEVAGDLQISGGAARMYLAGTSGSARTFSVKTDGNSLILQNELNAGGAVTVVNGSGQTLTNFSYAAPANSLMLISSGNLGLGIAAPTEKLDVVGNIKASGTVGAATICIAGDCKTAWPSAGGSGTVTSITATNGLESLSGSAITGAGTIGLANTTVSAGSFGTASSVPAFNVDAKGRLTGATNIAIANLDGAVLTTGTINSARLPDLAGMTVGTFGSAASVPVVTTDTKGRITAISTTAIGNLDASAITTGTIDAARLPATATKWLDATTGNIHYSAGSVGIGTATPGQRLHVSGNIWGTGSLIIGGSQATQGNDISVGGFTSNAIIGMDRNNSSGSGGFNMTLVAGSPKIAAVDKNGGDLYLSGGKATGTGSSNIYLQTTTATTTGGGDNAPTTKMTILGNGNVGIGKTAPTDKLDIVSTAGGASGVTIQNNDSVSTNARSAVTLKNDSTDTFSFGIYSSQNPQSGPRGPGRGYIESNASVMSLVASNAAGVIRFYTGGVATVNERMRVDAAGNVGIGVTTVTEMLDVAGNIKSAGTVGAAAVCINGDCKSAWPSGGAALPTGTLGHFLKSDGSNWISAAIKFSDLKNNAGLTAFNTAACTANETVKWSSLTDMFECMPIGSLNAAVLTAGTIDAARMPAFTGDVTSAVNTTVTALSTTGVAAGTYRSVTVDTKGRITAGTNPTTITDYGITDAVINGGQNGAVSVGTNNANDLTLKSNNTARMTITSGGSIGIGTASPNAKLEVAGALRLSSTTVDTYTTPIGSSVPTKVNIPFYDPGAFGQIVSMGVPSTAQATSRVISLFDARAVAHQPTLTVFSPDENNVMGFSWDGSSTVGFVKSSADLGLKVGATEAVRVLASNGNVGIGTSSPARLLHVNGPMRMTASAAPATPAAGDIYIDSTDSNKLKWHNGSGFQTVGSGNGDFLKDGSVAMTGNFQLGNNLLTNAGGTMGMSIDSSGRATFATLSGSVIAHYFANASPTSGSGSSLTFKSSTVNMGAIDSVVGTSTAEGHMVFSTRYTNAMGERMRINPGGSVGIGISVPTARLDVNGTVKATSFSGDGSGLTGVTAGASGSNGQVQFNSSGTMGGSPKLVWDNTNGYLGIGTNGPWGVLDVVKDGGSSLVFVRAFGGSAGLQMSRANGTSASSTYVAADDKIGQFTAVDGKSPSGEAGMNVFASQAHTAANQGMYVTFNTVANNSAASSERVRVTAAGDVGIGTSSPNAKLDVSGTGRAWTWEAGQGSTSGPSFSLNGGNYGMTFPSGTSTALVTNNAERLRITSTGNVGIGTNNPTDFLMVKKDQTSPTAMGIENTSNGINATALIAVRSDTNAAAIRAFGSGYTANLDGVSLAGAGQVNTWQAGAKLFIGTGSTAPMYLHTNNTIRMTLLDTGNVGIGTTAPGSLLHINTAATGDSSPYMSMAPSLASGSTVYNLIGRSAASNDSAFVGYTHNTTQASRSLDLGHYGQLPAVSIKNDGKVGIGTSAPTTALEVNGVAKATSFSVGPQIVTGTCSNSAGSQCIVTVTCPGGKTLLSGGYTTSWSAANVLQNYPSAGNAWTCAFYSGSSLGPHTCYALCANLQ